MANSSLFVLQLALQFSWQTAACACTKNTGLHAVRQREGAW